MTVLATIGGIGAKYLYFLSAYVPSAPISVASVPKTMSCHIAPNKRFEQRQPIVSPGIAAAVKMGNMQSISENLTWIAPEESPSIAEISVSTTYIAAITAARQIVIVLACKEFLFIFISFSFYYSEEGLELTEGYYTTNKIICQDFFKAIDKNVIL